MNYDKYLLLFLIITLPVIPTMAAQPDLADDPVFFFGVKGPDRMATPEHLDYIDEMLSICQFLDSLQVKDVSDPEFGGMIEDEFRPESERIVQSDNTQEALYVWTRYYELTGDNQFKQNVLDAWIYLDNFPSWNEESAYYRIWNCGWGLQCELIFREIYGNDKTEYSRQCAEHIRDNWADLSFSANPPGAGIRNALTVSWAGWNLYWYARMINNPEMMLVAQEMAETVKTWIEEDPENLGKSTWALSGGVSAACVLDVLFADNPAGASEWNNEYLSELLLYYPPEEYGPAAWVSAWDSWQALAQSALWRTTGNWQYRRNALEQSDFIRSLDTDEDGGIPANPLGSHDEDEAWVSTYIVLMGIAELDEPVQITLSMSDTVLQAGDTFDTRMSIHNPGLHQNADLYVLLELYGIYYFWPGLTETVSVTQLEMPIDFNLAEHRDESDPLSILTFSPWPELADSFEATWMAGLWDPYAELLVGDIEMLGWSARP